MELIIQDLADKATYLIKLIKERDSLPPFNIMILNRDVNRVLHAIRDCKICLENLYIEYGFNKSKRYLLKDKDPLNITQDDVEKHFSEPILLWYLLTYECPHPLDVE